LRLVDYIKTYGVEAVLGRVMHAREILRGNAAANVYNLKTASLNESDFAAWTKTHPKDAELLVNIEKLIEQLESSDA
jgi:hypothetical protein